MNHKKEMKWILVYLVCMTLMFYVAGSIAESNQGSNQSIMNSNEIVSLRTENSKTFLLPDGSYQYVCYAENIHYKDKSGNYLEIDNSIINTNEMDGYCLTNTANTWHVFFADDITKNRAITIENEGNALSFGLVGGDSKAKIQKATVLSGEKELYYREISEDNRAVVYKNVMPSVDIIYIAKTGCLKEDIVLRDRTSAHSFVFTFSIDNITPIQKGNNIYFIDDTGKEVFRTEDLFMEDAIGKRSDNVSLTLRKENNNYSIIISADDVFLNAEDTVYPVIIDPTVTVSGSANTYDTCVDEQYPSSNYYSSQNLWTGGQAGTNTMRTYIKFSLPDNIHFAQVTSATLRIKKREYATPSIKAYRVTQNWTSSSVTWNNKPNYTTTGGTAACTLDSGSWYKITVTSLVKSWMQGTYNNYGFLLKEPSETNASQKTKWYSSDAPYPNRPELVINYSDTYELDCWHSDDNKVAYWISPPSVGSSKLNSNNAFYFFVGLSYGRTLWGDTGINTTTASLQNSDIKVYGGTRDELIATGLFGDSIPANYGGLTYQYSNYERDYYYCGEVKKVHTMTGARVGIIDYGANETQEKHICAHELGHALGWYGHTSDTNDMMFTNLHDGLSLTTNDIEHLLQIYN